MAKSALNLNKMSGLLASKNRPVTPAVDSEQRDNLQERQKDVKTLTSNDDIVNLSFKVPGDFRKRFKLAAINAGVTQNELVQKALTEWEKANSF